ncbi:MAG TPA: RNA-binding protein [Pirellulales bacterium]|nr:RNA-binding protein [Pirellulales bacterium]
MLAKIALSISIESAIFIVVALTTQFVALASVLGPLLFLRLCYLAGRQFGPLFSTRKAFVELGPVTYLRSVVVGKRLYVGNLSYSVTNESLEELFAQFGAVQSAQVVMDRDTGRSKGFGFVEMGDDNAAQEAIRGLNDQQHDGRPLTVNEARPREERSGGGGGRGGYGGGGGRGGYGRR